MAFATCAEYVFAPADNLQKKMGQLHHVQRYKCVQGYTVIVRGDRGTLGQDQ